MLLGELCGCLGGCALTFGVLPIALGKALGRGGFGWWGDVGV